MLLDLESTGQEVYYAAPIFHKPEELNAAFMSSAVRARSIWLRPSDIGPLPDNEEHHVSFEPGSPWTLFSRPIPLDAKRVFGDVVARLHSTVRERGETELSQDSLERLARLISDIAEKRREISEQQKAVTRDTLRGIAPLQRIAYYASIFLESQLYIVRETRQVLG